MYYFIVNPRAGNGAGLKAWLKLEKSIIRRGINYEAYMTDSEGRAREFAARLSRDRDPEKIIAVVGGEGTFSEVIDGLNVDADVTLGYIPVGVGNDLARSLRISASPGRQIRRVLNPRAYRLLDYGVATYGEGKAEHRRFIVSSGLGLDAAISYAEDHSPLKRLFTRLNLRRLPCFLARLNAYVNARPSAGYVLLDRVKRVEFNNIYFLSAQLQPCECGGLYIAPRADASDGKLDVCVLSHSSKREISSILFNLRARFRKIPGMRVYECREVHLHLDVPQLFHIDGEGSAELVTDMDINCIPRKIRIIV